MPVTRPALCQHFALRRVQCGEQRRSPMASVIVGHALDVAKPHRQHRLRTFERLNLALFIHAQNHCIFWGIQVQPYNIPYFLYEKWIGRELEMFLSVWLYPESLPDAVHRGLRHPRVCGDLSDTPVRALFRFRLQRLANQVRYPIITDLPWAPTPPLAIQPPHILLQ